MKYLEPARGGAPNPVQILLGFPFLGSPPERESAAAAAERITAHFSLSFRSVGSSYFHSMSVPTSSRDKG